MQVIQIENCYCIMLPPNATSLIQPLDQGIIAMVKSRYRKWYLRWMLQRDNIANGIIDAEQQAASDTDEEQDTEIVPIGEPNAPVHHIRPKLRRGIRKLARVWANLEPVHIWNCWRKAEIMPPEWHSLYAGPPEPLLEREYEELGLLIPQVHRDPVMRMNAVEYVHDVCGENEREAVNSEEDRSPPASRDSPLSPPRGMRTESSSASPGSCSSQPRFSPASAAASQNAMADELQESRVYLVHDESPPWDDIQCGQAHDLTFEDLVDLDLNTFPGILM